jgi:hypothetical protein
MTTSEDIAELQRQQERQDRAISSLGRRIAELLTLISNIGGGSAFVTTAVQTSNYVASAFDVVLVDPSGGSFTVFLPAAPTKDDIVIYVNTTLDTTAISLSGNGNNVNRVAALTLQDPEQFAQFIFDGTAWWMMG